MEPWMVFAVLSLACAVVGMVVLARQPSRSAEAAFEFQTFNDETGGSVSDLPLPNEWNERSITQQFTQLRAQHPGSVPYFLNAVLTRFITGQDEKTVQKRTQFFRALCEELKVGKELASAMSDLKLHGKEQEKRSKELDLEHQKIAVESHRLDIESRRLSDMAELERRRETMKLELEMAKLELELSAIKNPPKPEVKKTPQEERIEQRSYWEQELIRLNQAKRAAIESLAKDDEEGRVRTANMYDNAVENARQQLGKFL